MKIIELKHSFWVTYTFKVWFNQTFRNLNKKLCLDDIEEIVQQIVGDYCEERKLEFANE